MSETVILETQTEGQTENRARGQYTDSGDNNYAKNKVPGFSDEEVKAIAAELHSLLEPIMAEHAGTSVRVDRLGGVVMTLGAAINALYPRSETGAMIIEGPASVWAEIQKMLSTAVEVKELVSKESEGEQEEAKAADETQMINPEAEEQEEANKGDSKNKIKNEAKKPEQEETQPSEERAEAESAGSPETKLEYADFVQHELTRSAQELNKAKVKIASSNPKAGSSNKSMMQKTLAMAARRTAESQQEPGLVKKPAGPQPIKKLESKQIDPKEGQDSPKNLKIVPKELIESEEAEITRSKVEVSEVAIEITEQEQEVEKVENEIERIVPEDGVELGNFIDFDEEELRIEHFEPDMALYEPVTEIFDEDLEIENELVLVEDETFSLEEIETVVPEELDETSLKIEGIESSLVQLAEYIEETDEETKEKLDELLDKIIEVPLRLDTGLENGLTEDEAQEELEKLFAELFDAAGVEYTPELIESLAYLTLKWNLVDEVKKLKIKEEVEEEPQESGTHEIIKQILVGISTIKKVLAHACAIGKSALKLYNFSFSV